MRPFDVERGLTSPSRVVRRHPLRIVNREVRGRQAKGRGEHGDVSPSGRRAKGIDNHNRLAGAVQSAGVNGRQAIRRLHGCGLVATWRQVALSTVDIRTVAVALIQGGRHLPVRSESMSFRPAIAHVLVIELLPAYSSKRLLLKGRAGGQIDREDMVRRHSNFMQATDGGG